MSSDRRAQITFGKFQNVDLRVARVLSAASAEGTAAPTRRLELDLGPLGRRISIGQYDLIPESDLVGRSVVVVANLGPRAMGPHVSEVLVLGTPHPDSPDGQAQAIPVFVDASAEPGSVVF